MKIVILATPIYYFGVSAQLKTVIDRFYSINSVIGGKKSVFIATMGNPDIHVGDSAKMMYDKMVTCLGWEDCGQLIVPGVWAAGVGCLYGGRLQEPFALHGCLQKAIRLRPRQMGELNSVFPVLFQPV